MGYSGNINISQTPSLGIVNNVALKEAMEAVKNILALDKNHIDMKLQ
ncbi:MAG: hypothetical protein JXR78_16260 [Victivallales bacterium]|nr:hypothetical protein [Victivallales bacterium]